MAIETIAVLGAGQMGSGIAQIAAANGYKVIMRDIKQEFCDKGVNTIKTGLEKQVARGKTTQEAADAILANISTTVELEGVAPADFVIEAVPEIMMPSWSPTPPPCPSPRSPAAARTPSAAWACTSSAPSTP